MKPPYSLPSYRRSYERIKLEDAVVSVITDDNERPAALQDISSRGIGLISNYQLKVNDKLEIVIKSSFFASPVNKKAKVAWCNRIEENCYRYGLDFGPGNMLELKTA